VRQLLDGVVEEADGRGAAGMRDGGVGDRRPRDQGRRAGGWRRPDRWAPPVGGCVRERGKRALVGRRWPKRGWAAAGIRKRGRGGWEVLGRGLGWLDRFCFFPFLFQIHFKSFSNLFKLNLLHLFNFKF
jgi:hypothetical protein